MCWAIVKHIDQRRSSGAQRGDRYMCVLHWASLSRREVGRCLDDRLSVKLRCHVTWFGMPAAEGDNETMSGSRVATHADQRMPRSGVDIAMSLNDV